LRHWYFYPNCGPGALCHAALSSPYRKMVARQSRDHRHTSGSDLIGVMSCPHRLGETWDGIVYAPPDWSIVAVDIEGASAQEAMVKAMRIVDEKLSTGRTGPTGDDTHDARAPTRTAWKSGLKH